jgi:hypothetical protein
MDLISFPIQTDALRMFIPYWRCWKPKISRMREYPGRTTTRSKLQSHMKTRLGQSLCSESIWGEIMLWRDDSPLTARMKSLVARPAEHRLFGTSSRWRLSEKMIPKTLEGESFGAWLWDETDSAYYWTPSWLLIKQSGCTGGDCEWR